MLKKLLLRFGYGAAKVDLILDQNEASWGDTVTGTMQITGGDIAQQIESIDVELRVKSSYQKGESTVKVDKVIATFPISDGLTIQPEEQLQLPVSLTIPSHIPLAQGLSTQYYIRSNLEIKGAIDPKDRDPILIHPTGLIKNFLGAMPGLGFELAADGYTGQEQLLLYVGRGRLVYKYKHITFTFDPAKTQHDITCTIEVDRYEQNLREWTRDFRNKDRLRFHYSAEQLATLESAMKTTEEYIEATRIK